MRRKIPILTLTALLLAGLAPLAAQPPGHGGAGARHGGGPGPDPLDPGFLARYLELTDSQKEEAKALFEAHREAIRPIHEEMKALGEELRALLDSDSPDATAVGEAVLALQALRERAATAREGVVDDLRGILTTSQQVKLDHLLEILELQRDRGRRGKK